jgi:hypothetical protein
MGDIKGLSPQTNRDDSVAGGGANRFANYSRQAK